MTDIVHPARGTNLEQPVLWRHYGAYCSDICEQAFMVAIHQARANCAARGERTGMGEEYPSFLEELKRLKNQRRKDIDIREAQRG